jgi:sugar phosphate isomerase/epimerase
MPWQRAELTYCSNVHPGTDLAAVERNIAGPIAGVRRHRDLARMGCGLWLSAAAARALAEAPERLSRLLDRHGLFLFTLNGFPYGDFHTERVKEAVYTPAWDEDARLAYTLDLARVLTRCLPHDHVEGTISTLPIGFAPHWSPIRHAWALDNLCRLAAALDVLAARSGRPIRVCLEPEPGCVIETTEQAISLFTRDLRAAAARSGLTQDILQRHLGICLDVCHQAVMFEDPGEAYQRLRASGVPVGKVQISSALVVPEPWRPDLEAILRPFAEPRYLHQVRCLAAGRLTGFADLPEALDSTAAALERNAPWRVHFHLPIQPNAIADGALATTRGAILGLLDRLALTPGERPHLEVETYTWQVLPREGPAMTSAELDAALAGELAWLEAQLAARDLLARD